MKTSDDLVLNLGVVRDDHGQVTHVMLDFGESVRRLTMRVEDANKLIADLQAVIQNPQQ